MSHLFTLMAGRSEDTFTLGGVTFEAAPLTLLEVGEFYAFRGTEDGRAFDGRCEWLAAKLRSRVRRPTDPLKVTTEWLLEQLDLPTLNRLEFLLVQGELPRAEDGEKKA